MKTSFIWKYAVVDVVNYLYKNRDVSAHIYYFSLELKYTEVYNKLFSDLLYKNFKKIYSRDILLGLGEERLTDEEIDFIETKCKPYLDFFDSIVSIIDTSCSPDSMVLYLTTEMETRENEFKFVIIDTVNAISADSGEQKMESIKKWNQDYALKIFRNENNCTVINISQLDKQQSQRQFSNKGESVWEKYIPTIESLGNDKEASNSASLVLSLFDPVVYNIRDLEGYAPYKFHGGFRMLYVLKNSFGDLNVSKPFYYDGARNHWQEIDEDPKEFTTNPALYQKYLLEEKTTKVSSFLLG